MTDGPHTATRDARVAAGWLAAQQDVAGRAAHELKNTLNGVAVNLEVVRSRLARPGVQPEQVQRFAESAADQLEALTRQVEALLSLTRAMRSPADVGGIVRQLLALRPPDAPSADAIRGGERYTDADADVVRLVLATAMGARAVPTLDGLDDGRARVRVVDATAIDDATRALAAGAGVEIQDEGAPDGPPTVTLLFPARGHVPAETDP